MRIQNIRDPAAIRAAMAEFDRVGRTYFLEKYGFGKAREYMLRDPATGRLYDSKAIVGAAHGYAFPERGHLTAADFSGGEATVEHLLSALGFEVVRIGQDWTRDEVGAVVFSNRDGEARGYCTQSIRKAILRAGLQNCRVHTLRHTLASRLIQNGMSVYEVREILGHSDIKTTMRYAHLESRQVTSKARDVINQLNQRSN